MRLALAPCPSYRAIPDPAGVRCVPGKGHLTICPGCGDLVPGGPCRKMLSSQDATLLGARMLGLDLDVEVPDDSKVLLP